MKHALAGLLAFALAASASARAQHQGHGQQAPGANPPADIGQALKDSHALLRNVERALNPYDKAALSEAAARYEAALDAIAAASGASAKDLNRAGRTLDGQIEKLRKLEASAVEPARETVARLLDAATVARDSLRADLDGLASPNPGASGGGHGGSGHGCGHGGIRRWLPGLHR